MCRGVSVSRAAQRGEVGRGWGVLAGTVRPAPQAVAVRGSSCMSLCGHGQNAWSNVACAALSCCLIPQVKCDDKNYFGLKVRDVKVSYPC